MNSKLDCLGLGIAPADILMGIDSFPKPGAKIDANATVMQGGGPVPTAMVTLARMGLNPGLLAVVGDDILGKFVINELKKENVETSYIIKKSKPTAIAVGWFEKSSGRRTITLELNIKYSDRDLVLSQLPDVRSIHLDGRYMPASIKLARWARKKSIPVILDVGSFRNDISPLLEYIDHLVCADAFALPYTKSKTCRSAVKKLKDSVNGAVVVTAGTDGSYGFDSADGETYQEAYNVKVVDTTGAGDAYHGAYIFGLLNGYSLKERMKFGSATAAIKCTRAGGRTGIPNLSQVAKFLKSRHSGK